MGILSKQLQQSIRFPLLFVVLIWLIKLLEYSLDVNWGNWGIYPRTLIGIRGIFFSPFLHSDFFHLLSNTVSAFVLLSALFYFYKEIAFKVFYMSILILGLWVWASARGNYHIGASGLIYSVFGFLALSGFFRKQKSLIAISLLTIFLYGSLIWGILPQKQHISWESHLFGLLTGILLAYYFKKSKSSITENNILEDDKLSDSDDYWNDVIEN